MAKRWAATGETPIETAAGTMRIAGAMALSHKAPRGILRPVAGARPGVAAPCMEIAENPIRSYDLTCRGNTIAVVSDGSSVYGFGSTGPESALAMLEGRSVFFKTFAGVEAFPKFSNDDQTIAFMGDHEAYERFLDERTEHIPELIRMAFIGASIQNKEK